MTGVSKGERDSEPVGSQNKLAKVLGVSRPYLGRVLSGEKSVTAKMIERLAAISI